MLIEIVVVGVVSTSCVIWFGFSYYYFRKCQEDARDDYYKIDLV